jgi:hypothetical protein
VRGIVAVLAVSLCANARATTIVAIWTPVKIVISGDSLINSNWTGANGVRRHSLSNDCKIRKFGTNYISAAGNYHIEKAGFDIWQAAARACGSSTNVGGCAARFREELRVNLGQIGRTREVHVAALVAGLENGVPALDHIILIGTPSGGISVRTESFRRGTRTWGRVILGERGAIDRYEASSPSTMSSSIQDQVLRLVRVEAGALPQEVGAPFSVLAIGTAGEHWINPGCCPASCSK